MRFDLHVHSNCSDGRDAVETILRAAVRRGLFGLSITDHDTLRGSEKAMRIIREEGLELVLIPGAEVTTSEGHLLCLGIEELVPRGRARRRRRSWPASRAGSPLCPTPTIPSAMPSDAYLTAMQWRSTTQNIYSA